MKRIALQPRLRLLAEMTPPGGRLADIGTDHGYLPVWLLQEGRIPSAIASDVGAEPLEHARRTAEEYETQGLDFRLCDGLSGIEPVWAARPSGISSVPLHGRRTATTPCCYSP